MPNKTHEEKHLLMANHLQKMFQISFLVSIINSKLEQFIGVLRGGARGPCSPPPPPKIG